jgi:hypothetical protein
MKNQIRLLISGAFLVTSLALLTGCDFFKAVTCPTCNPSENISAKPEDILLSLDGKPAITREQFEDFYEVARNNAGPYGAPSKRDAFNMMVNMEVLNRKMIKDGKDQTPEFKKDFARAYNVARWGVNSQILAKEVQEKIDTSDAAVEAFYNEQKGKNPAFDRPPFLKTPESIAIESVQFSSKPDAEAFLAKAKTNFGKAATDAKLTVKNLGNVSAQTQNVDFSIRLKARSLKPGSVELVQAGDKFFVIKGGAQTKAQYADFNEVKAMPQMKENLAAFKKQSELEPAFLKQVEEYKKEFTLTENPKYFEEDEAAEKAKEEQFKQMLEEQMKSQEGKKEAAPKKEEAPAAKASGVVAA